jgi:putative addiction module component (TIGR02574 family)
VSAAPRARVPRVESPQCSAWWPFREDNAGVRRSSRALAPRRDFQGFVNSRLEFDSKTAAQRSITRSIQRIAGVDYRFVVGAALKAVHLRARGARETRATESEWLSGEKQPMIYDMNARTKKLLEEVLELPASERALIVAELDASLEDEGTPEEIEKAWAEELERRAADVVAGRGDGRDARAVIDELRAELAAKR